MAASPLHYGRRDSFFDVLFSGLNPSLSSSLGSFDTINTSVNETDFDFYQPQIPINNARQTPQYTYSNMVNIMPPIKMEPTPTTYVNKPQYSQHAHPETHSEDSDEFDVDTSETSSNHSHSDNEHETKESMENLMLSTKKYKQPVSVAAHNLQVGPWAVNIENKEVCTIDVKFLFGRRKIKYEIKSPSRPKSSLFMEFSFSTIIKLQIKHQEKLLILQLTKRPNYTIKERGRCSKVPDFTENYASTYAVHCIRVANSTVLENIEKLILCDKRLSKLDKKEISLNETFDAKEMPQLPSATTPEIPCDWDGESSAVFHCEECNANYCQGCDDVIHRHAGKRTHKRIGVETKNDKKDKKRKQADSCRCGTGATRGTLGEPCTGNRCPCFSSARGCVGCGCKSCSNPVAAKKAAN